MGKDRRSVLSSISLVIILFFYFFAANTVLKTKIFTLLHRVTYENIFNNNIIVLNIDILILLSATITWLCLCVKNPYMRSVSAIFFSIFIIMALLSQGWAAYAGTLLTFPFISLLIILNNIRIKKILQYDAHLTLNYFTIGAIVVATFGIISLLLFIVTGMPAVTIDKYPYALYQQLLSILTPALMAVLIFCLPVRLIVSIIFTKLKIDNKFVLGISDDKVSTKWIAVYLSLCIMLGIAVTLIPHLSVVNPNNERLGVDTPRYVDWLNRIKSQTDNPVYFILKESGDRPLTMLILFLVTEAVKGDPFQVVEYSPLFLTSLLVLVIFFLTRQLTNNDRISIIAAFLSTISFQILIGIYSGFYANWLALILGYLAFALIVKYLRRPSKFSLVALALLMTGVLLAHLYTWSIIISIAFVFLIVLHILNYYHRKRFLLLYLILSSSIAVDILKSSLTGAPTGLEADASVGFRHGFGFSQFSERLTTLAETVQTYYGGVYANIAILGLVMYWLIRCKIRELSSIFMLIIISSALIPLFLGDWVLQSRVLYNIPFQIPAAISLYFLWKGNHKLTFFAIILVAGYLSFHVLANLGYVPPRNLFNIIQE